MADSKIVSFPFPQVEPEDCETFRDGVYQLKLKAIRLLNRADAGLYVLDEENIESIRWVNKMCLKVGLTPLDFE